MIVISYCDYKSFNIAIIKHKNSPTYIQRQINRILRLYCKYVCVYINNIVIFSQSLKNYIEHLKQVFDTLSRNNISIKSKKIFVNYFIVQLLDQKINKLDFAIVEDKLKTFFLSSFRKVCVNLKLISNLLVDYKSTFLITSTLSNYCKCAKLSFFAKIQQQIMRKSLTLAKLNCKILLSAN